MSNYHWHLSDLLYLMRQAVISNAHFNKHPVRVLAIVAAYTGAIRSTYIDARCDLFRYRILSEANLRIPV